MTTADELLRVVTQAKSKTSEVINDELIIDGETRTITVPDTERLFGVEGDVNIERKHFRCPKIVGDNIDLSAHNVYIAYVFTDNQNSSFFPTVGIGVYKCEDVTVEGNDITFSWKLSGNVFERPGFIAFKMYAKKSDDDYETVFNTTPAIGTVLMTIPYGTDEIVKRYPDVIDQIFDRLDALETGGGGTGGTTNYNNLSNKPQLNGVTLEGNKTLDQVGVLAKNQGSSNSGKFLSVGSDGNVVPADAPSGGTVDPEQIKQAVNGYLEENPVHPGATVEQATQIEQNKQDISSLSEDKVSKNGRDEVTRYNSEFYTKTANIYRKDRLIHNKMLITGTGVESDNSDGIISEFIEIGNNKTIGMTNYGAGINYVTFYFYDSSKEFISNNGLNSNNNKSMNIPDNAYYVRYFFNKLYLDYDYQITMPYTEKKIDAYIFNELPKIEKDISDLKDGNFNDNAISPKKTTFFDIKENLINQDGNVAGAIIGETGYFDPGFNTWTSTDYIPVMKDISYYLNKNGENIGGFTGAIYNKDKLYVEKINNQYPFVPSVDGYCRLSSSSWDNEYQLNPNTPYEEYIPYGESVSTLKEEVFSEDFKKLTLKPYEKKKILILGDSITHLDMSNSGWVKYFSEIVKPSVKINTAVDGATWKDKVEDQIYDGNPIPSTDGNCIGNQVQKITNEKNKGTHDYENFDVIIVAAGTNDSFDIDPDSETIDDVESQFISSYGNYGTFSVVPLNNVDRRTFSGIMRYTYQTLNELYPNAKFVICSPLQEVYENYISTYRKGELFKYIASRLSVHFFNTRDCGICNLYESPVENMDYDNPPNTESNEKRDLVDGIHTNENGGKKLGEYIAKEFIKLYEPIETI